MPSLLFAEHPYVLLFFTTTFRQTIWSSGFPINVNAMIDTLLRKMDVSENDLLYYHYGLVTVLETASVQLFCIFWTAFRNQLTDYLIFYIIFLLMRKYGGGFHFRDFLPCFITSIPFSAGNSGTVTVYPPGNTSLHINQFSFTAVYLFNSSGSQHCRRFHYRRITHPQI